MLFRSTRGFGPSMDIRRVALEGLAPDGGLYLPEAWPELRPSDLAALRGMPYRQVAFHVLEPYFRGAIPVEALREIIELSYAAFDHPAVAPLRPLGRDSVLELFHGPTGVSKDIALQFVGRVFDYFLRESDVRMTVIGATAGDTGPAALQALAHCGTLDLFILYPENGVGKLQRREMTCVDAPNVHPIEVDGTLDDCLRIVTALFANAVWRKAWNYTTISAVNLVRLLPQIVPYVAAALAVGEKADFVVPSGDFGSAFAGYAAVRSGAPVGKIMVACNENASAARFLDGGILTSTPLKRTVCPNMDSQFAGNIERALCDPCGLGGDQVRSLMGLARTRDGGAVSSESLKKARAFFAAGSASDEKILATIRDVYEKHQYIVDPHTAAGMAVGRELASRFPGPKVYLATAAAAKFPKTVFQALGVEPPLSARIEALIEREERVVRLPADVEKIAAFIHERKKTG